MATANFERLTSANPDLPLEREQPAPAGARVVFNKYWLRGLLLAVALGVWRQEPVLTIAGVIGLCLGCGQLLWLRFCLAGVEYERRINRSHSFWGETVNITVRIANKKPLPLSWLLTQDQVSDDRLEIKRGERVEKSISFPASIKSLLPMLPYGQIVRHYSVDCRQRGTFDFGPTTIESGDLLGYATRSLSLTNSHRLLVYPKLFELDMPSSESMRLVGSRRADRVILTDPSRTIGVRQYIPGDPLRQLEWRASARRQELLVRLFEPTTDPAMAIFLNSEVPVTEWDFYDPPQLEFCISLAASLARHMLAGGHPVGLFGNGEPSGEHAVRLPPSSHPDQLRRILETLALASPFGPVRRRERDWWEEDRLDRLSGNRGGAVRWRLPLGQLLLRESSLLPFEVSVVVITAAVDRELLAACRLAQRRRPVTLLLVEPEGQTPASLDGVRVVRVPYTEEWEGLDRLQLAA